MKLAHIWRATLAIGSLWLSPAIVTAQNRPFSLERLEDNLRLRPDRTALLEVLRRECVNFPVDQRTVARLKLYGLDDQFAEQLRAVCYGGPLLDVTSEPQGATVVVAGDTVGVSNGSFRVHPATTASVQLIRGSARRVANVELSPGVRTALIVELPSDTLPIPRIRTRDALVVDLGLQSKYPTPPPAPTAPLAPTYGSAGSAFTWGGLLMGAVAGGATLAVCNPTRTATTDGYLNGAYVPSGTSYQASLGPTCSAALAGGGALLGGLLNSWLTSSRNGTRRANYTAALQAFPAQQAAHAELLRQREVALAADPAIAKALLSDEQAAQAVRQRNTDIAFRNARLGAIDISQSPVDGSTTVAAAQLRDNTQALELRRDASTTGTVGTARGELLRAVPQTGRVNKNAVAVVIGNKLYKDKLIPTVDYAENDAEAVSEYLEKTFGFQKENIIFELNAGYTRFQSIFGTKAKPQGQLASYLAKDGSSDVFIFYSGHGAPDEKGQAYLVPFDGEPASLAFTAYPVDQLYENLATLKFRSITIALDACFSGVTERGSMMSGTSAMQLRVRNPVLAAPNATVFSASAPDEVAFWNSDKRHGMFTYHLLSRLRELAVATPEPGATSGAAIGQYVEAAVSRQVRRTKAGRDQRPQVAGSATDKPLPIFTPVPSTP